MRLLVADGHGLVRAGVRWAIENEQGFDLVGDAQSGAQLLARIEQLHPELVLLDMTLPGIDPQVALDRIRAAHPDVQVIVLAFYASPEEMRQLCESGADGVILKAIAPSDLAPAIRQIVNGTAFTSLGPAGPSAAPAFDAGLTVREQEFLVATAQGHSNKVIAQQMCVTEQTVKFHLTNIYRKLNLPNRTAAARWAYQHGLAKSPTT